MSIGELCHAVNFRFSAMRGEERHSKASGELQEENVRERILSNAVDALREGDYPAQLLWLEKRNENRTDTENRTDSEDRADSEDQTQSWIAFQQMPDLRHMAFANPKESAKPGQSRSFNGIVVSPGGGLLATLHRTVEKCQPEIFVVPPANDQGSTVKSFIVGQSLELSKEWDSDRQLTFAQREDSTYLLGAVGELRAWKVNEQAKDAKGFEKLEVRFSD